MRISTVLERIRDQCPSFATVDHALTSPSNYAYPAAMVTPIKATVRPNAFLGVHVQRVDLVFGVHIIVQRRQDGVTGYGAADDFDDLCAEVMDALKAWTPDGPIYAPFDFVGGQLAPFQDHAVTWRADYSASYDIRTAV